MGTGSSHTPDTGCGESARDQFGSTRRALAKDPDQIRRGQASASADIGLVPAIMRSHIRLASHGSQRCFPLPASNKGGGPMKIKTQFLMGAAVALAIAGLIGVEITAPSSEACAAAAKMTPDLPQQVRQLSPVRRRGGRDVLADTRSDRGCLLSDRVRCPMRSGCDHFLLRHRHCI